MTKRVANFFAGPSTLPLECLEEAKNEFLDFRGTGMSVIEISHRAKDFEAVVNEAEQDLKDLLQIPENYSIIFLHGGASFQFPLIPMNLKQEGRIPAYVNTGEWSGKAIKEAKILGEARVLASSEDRNFCYIPDLSGLQVPADASYLHITSNNTIFGTQYKSFPEVPAGVPLIADMSSDFLWKPFDIRKFGMVYAGAQKNVGPSGLAVIVIRNDLLEISAGQKLPTFFKYATHAKNKSLFNTPNSFGIYFVGLVLKRLKKLGGLEAMHRINEEKANLLYEVIGSSRLFKTTADKDSRSAMNVTFVMEKTDLEEAFLKEAKTAGLIGLKGHRSVGGFRASLYNAQEKENVLRLVQFMKDFEAKNG